MPAYSVAQAKTHLSKIIDEALAGENVTITRHGKTVVELRASPPAPRRDLDARRIMDEVAARRKLRPSLGESGADIIRRMRDGER
jgi:antitoxin (DNA-binding transcriptional repressor) of toxin-antitoxin stability system